MHGRRFRRQACYTVQLLSAKSLSFAQKFTNYGDVFGHYHGQVFKAICVQLLPSVIGLRQSTLVSSGPLLLKLDTLLCSLFGRYDMRVCGLKKLAKLNLKI